MTPTCEIVLEATIQAWLVFTWTNVEQDVSNRQPRPISAVTPTLPNPRRVPGAQEHWQFMRDPVVLVPVGIVSFASAWLLRNCGIHPTRPPRFTIVTPRVSLWRTIEGFLEKQYCNNGVSVVVSTAVPYQPPTSRHVRATYAPTLATDVACAVPCAGCFCSTYRWGRTLGLVLVVCACWRALVATVGVGSCTGCWLSYPCR